MKSQGQLHFTYLDVAQVFLYCSVLHKCALSGCKGKTLTFQIWNDKYLQVGITLSCLLQVEKYVVLLLLFRSDLTSFLMARINKRPETKHIKVLHYHSELYFQRELWLFLTQFYVLTLGRNVKDVARQLTEVWKNLSTDNEPVSVWLPHKKDLVKYTCVYRPFTRRGYL